MKWQLDSVIIVLLLSPNPPASECRVRYKMVVGLHGVKGSFPLATCKALCTANLLLLLSLLFLLYIHVCMCMNVNIIHT